jgi:hypothetical protein
LGNLADLSTGDPTFDVRRQADGSDVLVGQSATPVGLTAYCLIDTTAPIMTKDRYQLFLRFNASPEIPYLGPFDFEVI